MRVLTTLTRSDSGRAFVAEHDVVREPNRVRRSIGYVPQESGVDREAAGRATRLSTAGTGNSVGVDLLLLVAATAVTSAFATWTFRAYQRTL